MTRAQRSVSRRDFLKSGSGLVVAIVFSPQVTLAQGVDAAPHLPGSLNTNRQLSAWLRVNSNGTVTVFTGKVELGQGIASALAQIAAEELDVDYGRINMVTADTSRTPDEGFTAGSQSIEQSGTAIRFACAEARQILLAAAADKLGVEADDPHRCRWDVSAPGGKHTTYWAVTTDAMLRREATARPRPKATAEYRLIGQSLARRDIPQKFTGGAAYLQDLRLPGMVHARVVRPPVPRAELVSLDAAASQGVARGHQGSARRQLPRSRLRARGTGDQCALGATRAGCMESTGVAVDAGRSLRTPRVRTANAGLGGVRKGGAERTGGREADRGALYACVSAARLDRSIVRRGAERGGQVDGLDS